MDHFKTHLLREKIELNIEGVSPDRADNSAVALSNRIAVTHTSDHQKTPDHFAIRAHNMHLCARLAGDVLNVLENGRNLLYKDMPDKHETAWRTLYDKSVCEYEREYNPDHWVAVYHNGQTLFEHGPRHPILDLIENATHKNNTSYENSIKTSQSIFSAHIKKNVQLKNESTVALTMESVEERRRCGIILRTADRTTTFNYVVTPKAERAVANSDCITIGAAFLELVQLAFVVGTQEGQLSLPEFSKDRDLLSHAKQSKRRLNTLTAQVNSFENKYEITYRPERPMIDKIIEDAMAMAVKRLG